MDRNRTFRPFRWIAFLSLLSAVVPACAGAATTSPSWNPPYEVQVVVDGVPLREYDHAGSIWVEGVKGRRYALRLINHTGRRVEVVATVDGLDVVDGKTGDYTRKRGYVLGPWQTYDVEGFRLDMGRVAAFRFGSVRDSYAARTGSARNVGVIGVAFFEERRPLPPPPRPRPYRPQIGRHGEFEERWESSDGDARAQVAPADEVAESGYGSFGGAASKSAAEYGPAPARGAPSAAQAPSMDGLAQGAAKRSNSRPGLGTEFGESRDSSVVETTFVRASATVPTRIVGVRYDDRAGLLAQGVPLDPPPPSDTWLRATADPFPGAPHPRPFAKPPRGWHE